MTRHNPMVSVIIPAYRHAGFVNQAVACVMRQTLTDHEIIVVDDASGDEVVRQYDFPPSVRLIRRTRNSGCAAAPRNDGLRVARGRYIAFLDMDDLWEPDKLAAQVAILEANQGVAVTFCHYTLVDEALSLLPEQPHVITLEPDLVRQLIGGCFICSPTLALIRHDALKKVGGFDEQITATSDWDLWLRLAALYPFHADPVPRACYRKHAGQQTKDRPCICRGSIAVHLKTQRWADQHRPDLLPLIKRQLSKCFYEEAKIRMTVTRGTAADACRSLLTAVTYNPLNLRAYRGFGLLAAYAMTQRGEKDRTR